MKKGKPYKSLYLPALTIVVTVFTLLIIIAVSTYRNMGRERERTEDSLLREGAAIIRSVEAGIKTDSSAKQPDIAHIQKILEEVSRVPGIAFILLFDNQGNSVASGPAQNTQKKIKDASSLRVLLEDKGMITRYRKTPEGERTFEVIRPFRPVFYKDPLTLVHESTEKIEAPEDPLQEWSKDKIISLGLRFTSFDKARQGDLYHAFLMGAILVVLGTGALYFTFIVKNYYLVDRSLARMKTYTENVVESMADGLVSIDPEKKIVTLNRRAEEILGAEEKELKGKKIAELLGPCVTTLLEPEGGKAVIRDQEMEISHRSGGPIPLSLSATPLKDESGREMGLVLLLRDLREIRDLREKVRRSEHLASLGRLAAGVAHEIRNPLSSIRGFAQYFMQRFKNQEEEKGYASIMVKEVDRLNRVITELLDFARPREPLREPHDLEKILEHSLKLLEPELARKKVAVEKKYEPSLPQIPVDRDQISQALLNLLLNSLESIDEEGKIWVGLKKGTLPDSLELVIGDSGRGIPHEDLGKIFEPFFSTKRKGTGLGLAIVHQIVENHGGKIEVESREGWGTTFRIILPMNG